MIKLLMLSVLIISGCTNGRSVPDPHNFKCSTAQAVMMERDLNTCKNSEFFHSYCYKMAKSLYCEDIRGGV